MSKQIIETGAEARKKLEMGINKLADAVISTLGPNGRNAIFIKNGEVVSTKDGVSVAKSIERLEDPIENLGVQMIKQASLKTADKAGDGTTTSTLLTKEMVGLGLKELRGGVNAVEIKRGMDKAVKEVIAFIQKNISEDISSEDQLKQVATISANNDVEIGELIATAMDKVGKDGVVHIEESKSGDTYLETVEGMQFDRGYKSHFFVTNNNTMECVLDNPYILIADHRFSAVKDLLPILEGVSTQNRPLLIIAEDIDHEALATLIVNKARGTLKICAVKAPDFGDRRKLVLEDIAILTGGMVFDSDKGMKLDKFNYDWFGEARTVTINKNQTTIVDGKGTEEEINSRVESLQSQIEKSTVPFEKEQIQNRLAKMAGGVSIIHVGGFNETEMKEKKDRVDDALHATKAAMEEGIIPGGGCALLYGREGITNDNIGANIIYKACSKPFQQILINAGYDEVAALTLGEFDLARNSKNCWNGVNVSNGDIIDFKENGIIDPTKVCRVALENASSVASIVLLTETIIVNTPEINKDDNAMASMMNGMY
jgi:chaperonin GroEL